MPQSGSWNGIDDPVALSMWQIYIPPALTAKPSALSRIPPKSPATTRSNVPTQFTKAHFDKWIEFQEKKGKAVSKDTWSLLIDFIRTIDSEFKEYDEGGEYLI